MVRPAFVTYYCFLSKSNSIGMNRGLGKQCSKILICSSIGSSGNFVKVCCAMVLMQLVKERADLGVVVVCLVHSK